MDVQTDREEQFRQFVASHLERQTEAMERTARHSGATRAVLTIWLLLTLISGLLLFALNYQG